jgi:hypothetical protein
MRTKLIAVIALLFAVDCCPGASLSPSATAGAITTITTATE